MSEIVQGDRWIIFYEDGSTYCSADGEAWGAPRQYVQSIAQCLDAKDNDWCFVQGHDYYYFEKDRGGWCESREMPWQHLLRAYQPCVIFGSMLTHSGWQETHHKIKMYCTEYRDWLVGRANERPPQNYI